MALCRDWTKTLWPASFKGVAFHVQHDEERPGRRLVVHEFPGRDDPFIEDLGEAARRFSVEAYLASDTADVQAGALVSVMAAAGAGALVLPSHGVLTARALDAARMRDKDQAGYIAFRLDFVREGAAFALASVGLLASQVFAATASLSAVGAGALARADVKGRPERVAAAAADTLVEAAAALETVRTTYPVANEASATARDAITVLAADATTLASRVDGMDGAAASQLFDIASTLVGGMEATDALAALADLVDFGVVDAAPYRTKTARLVAAAEGEASRALRLAVLSAYAEALMAATFADRPSGIEARAAAAERFGAEMGRCVGGLDAELYVALAGLRGLVCAYLTRLITDLAPVAEVEAPRSLPSLWWGWRLYKDPERGAEIVARNRVPHPSFVPARFEALIS